jgi:large repetitive protein
MAQLLGPPFGTGKDGYLTISGTQNINTYSTLNADYSAGVSSILLTSTTGFYNGDLIMIHKSRGELTTPGTWEINRIVGNPSSNYIGLSNPTCNAYYHGSNDVTQIVRIPEYLSVTLPGGSDIISPSAWDGSIGGIIAFVCSGLTTINGQVNANGSTGSGSSGGTGGGFRGGAGYNNGENQTAWCGEGTTYAAYQTTGANGGSGGASHKQSGSQAASSGGGGNATGGGNGVSVGASTGGTGGGTTGNQELTTMTFGGASGGTAAIGSGGKGGSSGGGIIFILTKSLYGTGIISSNGANGQSANGDYEQGASGGSAGGSILIKGQRINLSGISMGAAGGTGGAGAGGRNGGNGGDGRIRIETSSYNAPASTTVTPSTSLGYMPWVGGIGIRG